jgi:hypothetical protein
MADTVLTLNQIENLFQRITTIMLGLNPDLPEYADKVRIAWPAVGAPGWKRTEDIAFIKINNAPDPINIQRDVVYSQIDIDNAKRKVTYTRVHNIMWTFYGPNSFDHADLVRSSIFLPQIREEFEKSNLFLVLDVSTPNRAPELFQGQWWERTDLTAYYNEKVVRDGSVPYIKSTNVRTYTPKGEII